MTSKDLSNFLEDYSSLDVTNEEFDKFLEDLPNYLCNDDEGDISTTDEDADGGDSATIEACLNLDSEISTPDLNEGAAALVNQYASRVNDSTMCAAVVVPGNKDDGVTPPEVVVGHTTLKYVIFSDKENSVNSPHCMRACLPQKSAIDTNCTDIIVDDDIKNTTREQYRKEAILRWKEKRGRRVWHKKVVHKAKQTVANNRIRIGGRFV